MEGLVVKAIAGFFYVECEDGNLFECKARGNLKTGNNKIKVGDLVKISEIKEDKAVIEKVFSRKNSFIRPDIANVDSFVVLVSIKEPEINLELLDKFIVMAEKNETEVIICINKLDLLNRKEAEKIASIYENLYKTVLISAKDGNGIEELKALLSYKKVAFTGPSGVGKSTLTNLMLGFDMMQTGQVSAKRGRGKHTTRHSQIFSLENGAKIFDTPGFTAFEVADMEERELKNYYPEFREYGKKCKYANCNHLTEPECGVRQALGLGKISQSRYDSYRKQFASMSERNKKW